MRRTGMEIDVRPFREYKARERFDPYQLAGKEGEFDLSHRNCGGAIAVTLEEKRAWLLFVPLPPKYWYRFACAKCGESYETQFKTNQDISEECQFIRQCLRRVLTERSGPYGSSSHVNFHYGAS